MTTHIAPSPAHDVAADRSSALKLTAAIVSAYLAKNALPADGLPGLIQATFDALSTLGRTPAGPETHELVPAVPVRKSVFPDHIICLEDGRSFKSLKRHLRTAYGMMPADYRAKWSLPADYPMVAPNYAAHRAELARSIGLGRRISANTDQTEAAPPAPAENVPDEPTITRLPERRRGRRPKSA